MIPKFPFSQDAIRASFTAIESILEPVQERIEIVVMNDVTAPLILLLIMFRQVPCDLESDRRFSGTLFTENDRGGRGTGVPVDLLPTGMVGTGNAVFLENRIRLGILFGEGVATDLVVFQKLLNFHDADLSRGRSGKRLVAGFPLFTQLVRFFLGGIGSKGLAQTNRTVRYGFIRSGQL